MKIDQIYKSLTCVSCIRNIKTNQILLCDGAEKSCCSAGRLKCDERCLPHFQTLKESKSWNQGLVILQNKLIDNKPCNLIFIKSGDLIITYVFNIDDSSQHFKKELEQLSLTPREVEICLLKLAGRKNKEISKLLFISPLTLKTHLNNCYKKLPKDLITLIKKRGLIVKSL
ncbi:MAG: helix-turn-helix transcriptional regulator [Halobacteriovoraceae bacterium]|nr:helix-turn-helix transcriptional regulator [Halobacteriovoraceae bacterium]